MEFFVTGHTNYIYSLSSFIDEITKNFFLIDQRDVEEMINDGGLIFS